MPNVLIRTDMGGTHGMGHAVRCLALAQALAARGANVSFVTTTPMLVAFVAPWPCDVRSSVCLPLNPEIFVVDTKDEHITAVLEALRAGRQGRTKVVYIDQPHITPDACHLCIVPCAHWDANTVSAIRTAFGDRFLYGWDYVMLAPEVTNTPPIPYDERRAGPIVFCAGGSDPTGVLATMLAWTQRLDLPIEKHFVCGAAMEERWDTGQQHTMVTRLYSGSAYREQLRQAALVVGMFGQTSYECLWYHTPMLMFAHTEEDARGARALQEQTHHALCAQDTFCDWESGVFRALVGLVYTWSIQRTTAMPSFIDGLGIQRVADAILAG